MKNNYTKEILNSAEMIDGYRNLAAKEGKNFQTDRAVLIDAYDALLGDLEGNVTIGAADYKISPLGAVSSKVLRVGKDGCYTRIRISLVSETDESLLHFALDFGCQDENSNTGEKEETDFASVSFNYNCNQKELSSLESKVTEESTKAKSNFK